IKDSLAEPNYSIYWLRNGVDTVSQNDTFENLLPGKYTVLIVYPRFNCSQALSFEIKQRYFENIPKIVATYNCYNQQSIAYATLSHALNTTTTYQLVWLNAEREKIATGDTVWGLKDGAYFLNIITKYCDTIIPFNIISQ